MTAGLRIATEKRLIRLFEYERKKTRRGQLVLITVWFLLVWVPLAAAYFEYRKVSGAKFSPICEWALAKTKYQEKVELESAVTSIQKRSKKLYDDRIPQ